VPEGHVTHRLAAELGSAFGGRPVAVSSPQGRFAETAAELRGPQTCALLTADERDAVVLTLGPDPLRPDADPLRGWARVTRSGRPIASLLLDQRVAAGVGNIFRCEALYRQRLHPLTPGNQVTRRRWDFVELMPPAVVSGRIDTVRPEHTPEAMGRPPRVDRHGGEVYVYRRAGDPCLVCGTEVSMAEFEARRLYWCRRCQRRR
jgi:endonuclease-8